MPNKNLQIALMAAYDAIITAINEEEGLEFSQGMNVLELILELFETPFPPVTHGNVGHCAYIGKHEFSDCGLAVPPTLTDEFILK